MTKIYIAQVFLNPPPVGEKQITEVHRPIVMPEVYSEIATFRAMISDAIKTRYGEVLQFVHALEPSRIKRSRFMDYVEWVSTGRYSEASYKGYIICRIQEFNYQSYV